MDIDLKIKIKIIKLYPISLFFSFFFIKKISTQDQENSIKSGNISLLINLDRVKPADRLNFIPTLAAKIVKVLRI